LICPAEAAGGSKDGAVLIAEEAEGSAGGLLDDGLSKGGSDAIGGIGSVCNGLEGAGGDERVTGVCIGTGEGERAGSGLGDTAPTCQAETDVDGFCESLTRLPLMEIAFPARCRRPRN